MAHRGAASVEIKVQWAGRARRLSLGRCGGLLVVALLPIIALWLTFASLYLVFHDDLLASLIKRQTDMQYAYEDRIATLRSDVDMLTAGGEAEAPRAAVRDLAARGARLEARAASLEALAARLDDTHPVAAPLEPALRFGQAADDPRSGSGPYAGRGLDALAAGFGRAEAAQSRAAERLRAPMLRKLARIDAALAETGLPPSRWRAGIAATGGPFVPMAGGGPDATLALLREAALEQDRLGHIVATIPLRRPVDGTLDVTSPFGPRIDPFLGRAAMHTGIDLHEAEGDAVRATADGTITVAGPEGGYGNMVEIDHGAGLVTRYGHLSAVLVAPGQRVAAGVLVGRVGATGRATGPHLHYETRIAGEPVDPARFLKAAAILSPER